MLVIYKTPQQIGGSWRRMTPIFKCICSRLMTYNGASFCEALNSQYLAGWVIARLEGIEAVQNAMHYVAPVGGKDEYISRTMQNITPFLDGTPGQGSGG
jgi:hypothetical protein